MPVRYVFVSICIWFVSNAFVFGADSVYSKLSDDERLLANQIKHDLVLLRNHLFNATGTATIHTSRSIKDQLPFDEIKRTTYFGNVQDSQTFLRVDYEPRELTASESTRTTIAAKMHTIATPDGAMNAKVVNGKAIVTSLKPPGHSGEILVEPFFQAATYVTFYKAEDWIFTKFGDVKEASIQSTTEASSTPGLELKAVIGLSGSDLHLRILFARESGISVKNYELRKEFADGRKTVYTGSVETTSSKDSLPTIQKASREVQSSTEVSKTLIEFESMTPGAVALDLFTPEAIGVTIEPTRPRWGWLVFILLGLCVITLTRFLILNLGTKSKPETL